MIYTLGHRETYQKGLEEFKDRPQDFVKTGKYPGYPGGSVWQTPEEVWDHIDRNKEKMGAYSVYEIDADWGTDTRQSIGYHAVNKPWHDLLRDAVIMREVPRS